MSRTICVIILNWNRRADVRELLASLTSAARPDLRMVVVDNGSTDGSQDLVRREFPSVLLLQNETNLGYAEGNNVGLRYALDEGIELALLLNNDVTLAPDAIDQLANALDGEPSAALAGPLVYHHSEPRVIQSAGGTQTPDWRFVHRGQNQMDEGQYSRIEPVDWVTGCAILARGQHLKQIGVLDPRFYLYAEEVDWCLRTREAGFRVLFAPQARVWHKGVSRAYRPSPLVTYYSARNELLLLTKHRAGGRALASALVRDLRTLVSWSLRPRWRNQGLHRQALLRALVDFARRRFGPASGLASF